MSKGLNFKDFSHVHTKDGCSVFKHKQGHFLRIYHDKLSPENKEEVLKMAKGGKVEKHETNQTVAPVRQSSVGRTAADALSKLGGTLSPHGRVAIVQAPVSANPHGRVLDETGNLKQSGEGSAKGKRFAEGGEVSDDSQSSDQPNIADSLYSTDPQAAAPVLQQRYDEGKEAAKDDTSKELAQREMVEHSFQGPFGDSTPEEQLRAAQGLIHHKEYQSEVGAQDAQQAQTTQDALAQAHAQLGLGDTPPQEQQVGLHSGLGAEPQAPTQDPAQQPQGAQNPYGGIMGGYAEEKAGIDAEARAKGDLGAKQADVLAKQQAAVQSMQQDYQQRYNALDAERQAHIADIQAGHIDPNKYWVGDANGNGSHSRIASAIGMILAGFNPAGTPNAAINFLQQQQEMNLKAQAQNLDSKQNLLRANLEQFHNMDQAMTMTRLMQNDVVSNQLAQEAAKAQNPMAKAQALQAKGMIDQKSAMFQRQLAIMGTAAGMSGKADSPELQAQLHTLRAVDPKQAAEIEKKYVPGVGVAQKEVPEAVRAEMVSHNNFANSIKDLQTFVDHNRTLVPGTPAYIQGQQKALELQSQIRESQLGTVFRESEKPLLEKMLNGNPAGLMSYQTKAQLSELQRANDAHLNQLKQGVGLPVAHMQGSNEPIKGADGKMYQRQMINGKSWLIPVK